jgi:hypothetical protein
MNFNELKKRKPHIAGLSALRCTAVIRDMSMKKALMTTALLCAVAGASFLRYG